MTAASVNHDIIDMQGVNTAFGIQGIVVALALIATIKYIK
jgi:hypothetical protein